MTVSTVFDRAAACISHDVPNVSVVCRTWFPCCIDGRGGIAVVTMLTVEVLKLVGDKPIGQKVVDKVFKIMNEIWVAESLFVQQINRPERS